jgi:hypothetical protein
MSKRIRELTGILFPERLKKQKAKKADPKYGEHYLYAISDGKNLKVGYSKDPKSRLKRLQTGSSKPLKLLWQCLCAYSDTDARKQERKLHRRLRRHNIQGEWYQFDCLVICRAWRIKGITRMRDEYHNQLSDEALDKELDLIMLREMHQVNALN